MINSYFPISFTIFARSNTHMMKKYIILLLIAFEAAALNAQVSIGTNSVTNTSVSLEFGPGNKGLLLPWVNSASAVTGAVGGTIIYDTADKKVKYKKGNVWSDLSVDNSGVVDTSLQNSLPEQTSARVAIGKNAVADSTPGILILTDTDKAMILPKVPSPHLNIINPSAGMIVYDTDNHQLATFNGTVWSFWKP